MEHLIVLVPALPVPNNKISGSSRTTSNALATSSPIKAKRRKSNPSGWCASKIKKQKLKVSDRPIYKLIFVYEPITCNNAQF